MQNYFNEINSIIENTEVSKRIRIYKDNSETLKNYWNIGKLLIEAQGGEARAKYGNGLIKEWSKVFVEKYGKGYDSRNLRRMRQFYVLFSKWVPMGPISWSHFRYIFPLKNENERNYYINQVILNNLSKNDLIKLIKSKSYDRLSLADKENIKLIEDNNYSLDIKDMIKDPILIKINNMDKLDEKALHKYIIEMVSDKFLELGSGFALIAHEYKIIYNNRTYRIKCLCSRRDKNKRDTT